MVLAAAGLSLLLAVALTFLYRSIVDLRHDNDAAVHSLLVLATANQAERLVLDLESGQRGYVITRDPRFLEPWTAARRAAPEEAALLRTLVAGEADQAARVERIERGITAYLRDYSVPLVDSVRTHPGVAAVAVASGEGRRRVDALRREFDAVVATERGRSAAREQSANAGAHNAIVAALAASGVSLLLIVGLLGYMGRVAIHPIRRLAVAAQRVADGDLTARVPEAGTGEVHALKQSFNRMAASLEESRDELESQNAELEVQTAELEDSQTELTAANDELVAQRSELERALAELGEERRHVGTFYSFAEQLARATEPQQLLDAALEVVADFAAAEAGVVYAFDEEGAEPRLAATRGVDREALAPVLRSGVGLAGRAYAERRTIAAGSGQTSLTLPGAGRTLAAKHELHVPLVHGDEALGALTLARVAERPFEPEELAVINHLAAQASAAYANLLAHARERRAARVNAAVLQATQDAITLADPSGRVILRNGNAQEGLVRHGVRDGGITTIRGVVAEMRPALEDPDGFEEWMEQTLADESFEGALEFRLADGGGTFVSYTTPVHDADGTPIGRLFVVRDVTTEREAEQLKTDLVATVSHELRTPLASILGFAELLAKRDPPAETRRRYLETIYNEGRRLTALVDEFLDLQRIEERGLDLVPAEVDLAELAATEVALFEKHSTLHTVELDFEDPLVAHAERDRIAQVLSNLLSNAIKYSPGGGTVVVKGMRRGEAAWVSVTDPGIGIPAAQQADVFKRFFRVDSSDTRTIGGTGLGLALCKQIVEAHGGRIGLESVEGRGTTFWFELPLAASRADAA